MIFIFLFLVRGALTALSPVVPYSGYEKLSLHVTCESQNDSVLAVVLFVLVFFLIALACEASDFHAGHAAFVNVETHDITDVKTDEDIEELYFVVPSQLLHPLHGILNGIQVFKSDRVLGLLSKANDFPLLLLPLVEAAGAVVAVPLTPVLLDDIQLTFNNENKYALRNGWLTACLLLGFRREAGEEATRFFGRRLLRGSFPPSVARTFLFKDAAEGWEETAATERGKRQLEPLDTTGPERPLVEDRLIQEQLQLQRGVSILAADCRRTLVFLLVVGSAYLALILRNRLCARATFTLTSSTRTGSSTCRTSCFSTFGVLYRLWLLQLFRFHASSDLDKVIVNPRTFCVRRNVDG